MKRKSSSVKHAPLIWTLLVPTSSMAALAVVQCKLSYLICIAILLTSYASQYDIYCIKFYLVSM
jgi:hypothetical protein